MLRSWVTVSLHAAPFWGLDVPPALANNTPEVGSG